MPSLTLRDVPEHLLAQLKVLSERGKKSLDEEALAALGEGLAARHERSEAEARDSELQNELWLDLCGTWEDERCAEEPPEGGRPAKAPKRPAERQKPRS